MGRHGGRGAIAWEESGSGPPIVFVHGITEDRRGWDAVVPLLEDSFRCVRFDLRGHGESDDAEDYSVLAMSVDISTVVAKAGITEPPLLVGHSLGGIVVTAYAACAPVRGVVNVDQTLAMGASAAMMAPMRAMLRGTESEFREAMAYVFAPLGVDEIPEPWRAWAQAKHSAARQEVVLGVWDLVLDSDSADMQEFFDRMLGAIVIPYLAIHGSSPGDTYVQWLRAVLPSAALEVWDGHGHYPHLVAPERFAARIRTFAAPSGRP